jgi:uncharacterized phage protein gp47/JayE
MSLDVTSIFTGTDTTLPQSIIDRQSDTNLRTQAIAAFAALAPGMDTVEGSWAFDLIAPFALIVAQAYFDLIDVERRTSLATATGLGLDRLGELYGVARAPASYAEGYVSFTGTAPPASPLPQIPQSTTVSTTGANAQSFITMIDATIPGPPGTQGIIVVPVRALVAGAAGNVPAGAISIFALGAHSGSATGVPPAGISSVINPAALHGGSNIQPDGATNQFYDGYRGDIYILANARGEGGAAKHLRKWARSVPGVGHVTVLEAYPAPGWVTLVLLDTEGHPADADLVHAVEAKILDPWYLYNEAEHPPFTLGGGATLSGTETPDATPLGQTDNAVRMQGSGSIRHTIWGPTPNDYLKQPGVWRLKPRMRLAAGSGATATPLFTMGVWDNNIGDWAFSRPNNNGVHAVTTVNANQIAEAFIPPDIDTNEIDFAWNGYDRLELRIDMTGVDPSVLYVDQINYFAIMSRDDRDVGLSPAGMRVNVVAALPVSIDISATITYRITSNMTQETIDAAIQRNLEAYFRTQALGTDRNVRRASVEDVIYNTVGVGDVGDVELNGALQNIQVRPTEVPMIGTLTWTAAT